MDKIEEQKKREIEFVKEKLEDKIVRLKKELKKKRGSKKYKNRLEEEILETQEKINTLIE